MENQLSSGKFAKLHCKNSITVQKVHCRINPNILFIISNQYRRHFEITNILSEIMSRMLEISHTSIPLKLCLIEIYFDVFQSHLAENSGKDVSKLVEEIQTFRTKVNTCSQKIEFFILICMFILIFFYIFHLTICLNFST